MNILNQIWLAVWFFLPAGVANMAPVIADNIPGLNQWNLPMDFNLTFRGRRVFGPNKTWRGFLIGILLGMVVSRLQGQTYVLGLLLGSGALLGDAIKSFFKRQIDIPSGESWLPFDQIDYIIGGVLFSVWYHPLPLLDYAFIFIVYFFLHMIVSAVGFLMGLKQKAI